MSRNVAKTLVWKHGNDIKLWRHKQGTPNTNDHHMTLNQTLPWKFSVYTTAWSRSFWLNRHTQTSFLSDCILLGMSVTSLCGSLGSNPARQRTLEYSDSFLNQPLWLRLLSFKRNSAQNLINDKFPHERMLLVSQNESRLDRLKSRLSEQCRQCQKSLGFNY